MKKSVALLLCALLAFSVFAACGGNGAASTASTASTPSSDAPSGAASDAPANDAFATTLADIQAKGELVIGLDDTFAPMGFHDVDGSLVGFDIDLATAVCEKLGVTATFQPIVWEAKEMELSTGKIDCIWNGMSITPERQEAMSLSNAYLHNKMIVMTNTGISIASKEDMANYNIGIQASSGALAAVMADPVYAVIESKIVEYPTYDEAILDMGTGRIDCIVIDEVYGNYKNTQLGGKFGTASFDFGDDLFAIGFRKSDTELTEAVNNAIAELVANATAAEISIKWFGEDVVIG